MIAEMRWLAALPATLLVLGACSLFTELDGFSGDRAAAIDAADEQAANDGSVTTDGGAPIDGSVITDGAAPALCAPGKHAFCADFEQGALVDTWNGTYVTLAGGLAEISSVRARDGVKSLLASLPRRGDVNTPYYAQAAKKIPTNWRKTKVEFDLFVETPDWQAGDINSGFYVLTFSSDGESMTFNTSIGPGYTTLGVTDEPFVGGGKAPDNQWVHVTLDVSFADHKLTHTIGSETITSPLPSKVEGANGVLILELGVIGYNDPAPLFRFFYDNVTVDFL